MLKYDAPELAVEVALLGLPRHGAAEYKSRLLPDGIPILRSEETNEHNMRELIRDMSDSKLVTEITKETEEGFSSQDSPLKARARGRGRGANGRKKNPPGAAAATSSLGPVHPSAASMQPLTSEDMKMCCILLEKQKEEIRKIDATKTELKQEAEAFCSSCHLPDVDLQKERVAVPAWTLEKTSTRMTRQLFKVHCLKKYQLRARPSDPDIPMGDVDQLEAH